MQTERAAIIKVSNNLLISVLRTNVLGDANPHLKGLFMISYSKTPFETICQI